MVKHQQSIYTLKAMARIHTHYDNLKVARNAPPEVIRAAYKTLSQKYHPDRNPTSREAVRIIQIINTSYAVLSDPTKRQEHDVWIANSEKEKPSDYDHARSAKSSHAKSQRTSTYTQKAASTAYRKYSPPQPLTPVQKAQILVEHLLKNFLRKIKPVVTTRR